jgi:hypothetical protein
MDIHDQLTAGISGLQNKSGVAIYRSKRKIWGLLIRSLIVIVLIVFSLGVAYSQDHSNDKWAGFVGGGFCFLIAILVIISVSPKLDETNPAIVLNEKGITWNMHHYEPLQINWENIVSIKAQSFKAMNFLVIEVNNSYRLKEGRKGLQSFYMEINQMVFGSPICFRASTLQMNFDKLSAVVNEASGKYRNK